MKNFLPAAMRVAGLKGAVWCLAMALCLGQGREKHFFDRFWLLSGRLGLWVIVFDRFFDGPRFWSCLDRF